MLIHSHWIIVSIWRKLVCLYACKKSTSSFTSFLTYLEEIANLLFWVIWACLATHKIIVSIKKYLWFLSTGKNQFHPSRFPWYIAKISQTCYFGYFGNGSLRIPKLILSICRKPWCLALGKKSTSFTRFFEAIAKIWKLECLSECQKKLHYSLLFWDITFWRILQFVWPTAYLPIPREAEFC